MIVTIVFCWKNRNSYNIRKSFWNNCNLQNKVMLMLNLNWENVIVMVMVLSKITKKQLCGSQKRQNKDLLARKTGWEFVVQKAGA